MSSSSTPILMAPFALSYPSSLEALIASSWLKTLAEPVSLELFVFVESLLMLKFGKLIDLGHHSGVGYLELIPFCSLLLLDGVRVASFPH